MFALVFLLCLLCQLLLEVTRIIINKIVINKKLIPRVIDFLPHHRNKLYKI